MADNRREIVMTTFKNLGYEIYNFDSGWWGTRQLSIADENICGKNQNLDFHILFFALSKEPDTPN